MDASLVYKANSTATQRNCGSKNKETNKKDHREMFLTIQLLQDMGGSCKLNSHTYFLHRILTEGKCSFLLVLFVWKAELLRNDWEHILTKGIWQKLESHKSISLNTPSELQNQQPNEKQAIQTPPSFTEKARKRTTPHSRLQQS